MHRVPPETKERIRTVSQSFQIEYPFLEAIPYGNGHIHDTYLVTHQNGTHRERYVYQRVNHHVFTRPKAVMENVTRVTQHIQDKLAAAEAEGYERRVLTFLPTKDGDTFLTDDEGYLWRASPYIENTTFYDLVTSPSQAYELARSFGEYLNLLADLDPGELHETIPNFHNTPRRFDNLIKAVEADTHNRAARVRREIDFALGRQAMAGHLMDLQQQGRIPVRAIHNDAKVNNLLFDTQTKQGICVTDLDTTMAGLSLYDFGDMVRTAITTVPEDEPDLREIPLELDFYEGLVWGYLDAAGDQLTPDEIDNLVFAGKLITFETGLRFLTDYLQGDVYFKTAHPNHNLDRCRTQFALVAEMEQKSDALQEIVAHVTAKNGLLGEPAAANDHGAAGRRPAAS